MAAGGDQAIHSPYSRWMLTPRHREPDETLPAGTIR
jgi:hypothetical protein